MICDGVTFNCDNRDFFLYRLKCLAWISERFQHSGFTIEVRTVLSKILVRVVRVRTARTIYHVAIEVTAFTLHSYITSGVDELWG